MGGGVRGGVRSATPRRRALAPVTREDTGKKASGKEALASSFLGGSYDSNVVTDPQSPSGGRSVQPRAGRVWRRKRDHQHESGVDPDADLPDPRRLPHP